MDSACLKTPNNLLFYHIDGFEFSLIFWVPNLSYPPLLQEGTTAEFTAVVIITPDSDVDKGDQCTGEASLRPQTVVRFHLSFGVASSTITTL